nr:hypothetical protein [Tanacetum cinerariifolium]
AMFSERTKSHASIACPQTSQDILPSLSISKASYGRQTTRDRHSLLMRLQTQMTEFERHKGPAKGPVQPDALEEAGSSS